MKNLKILILFIVLIIGNRLYSQENTPNDKVETIMIHTKHRQVNIIYPNNKKETKKVPSLKIHTLVKEKIDYWLNEGYELESTSSSGLYQLVIVLVKKPKQ